MPKGSSSPGPSVDRLGIPVVDPTLNVRHEMAAAVQRLDDLRFLETRRMEQVQFAELRRQDDLRMKDAGHLKELMNIAGEHQKELSKAESERLNAIRAVDVNAVAEAARVNAAQAAILAQQVSATADAARQQVAAVAAATEIALRAALGPIQDAVNELRKNLYASQGGAAAVGDRQTSYRDSRAGTQWAITAGISLLFLLVAIISYLTTHK